MDSFLMHIVVLYSFFVFFFFNDTATTEIYTLSLHDALPISPLRRQRGIRERENVVQLHLLDMFGRVDAEAGDAERSEEHTSELQSQSNLVCRLLLEKKKTKQFKQETTDSHT